MAKSVKVTFLKSPSGSPFKLAYSAGDSATVGIELAKKLLDAGLIEAKKTSGNRKTATKKNTGEKR